MLYMAQPKGKDNSQWKDGRTVGKSFLLNMPLELHKKIKAAAKAKRISITEFINQALWAAVENKKENEQ